MVNQRNGDENESRITTGSCVPNKKRAESMEFSSDNSGAITKFHLDVVV